MSAAVSTDGSMMPAEMLEETNIRGATNGSVPGPTADSETTNVLSGVCGRSCLACLFYQSFSGWKVTLLHPFISFNPTRDPSTLRRRRRRRRRGKEQTD
ncbi:hypothetical protein NQZ68_011899 [Dissostichus eleginoides]|nr:hypothetical protein NQZ68_011899 [Dissostichus eleginoides]